MKEPDGTSTTVAARIRSSLDRLTAKEKQVARVILAQYPAAGLETTAALSSLARVSGPTVVRFVAALGYANYRDFQSDLRLEIAAKTASPITKAYPVPGDPSPAGYMALASSTLSQALEETLGSIPDSELADAVAMLADTRLRIHCIGGRYTRIIADYLATHLESLRDDVRFHRDHAAFLPIAAGVSRRDCVVFFDFRRYQSNTIDLAKLVRAQKSKIILVTDPWMSPIAQVADIVLSTRVESVSPFDSHVSTLALAELLIGGVFQTLGEGASSRLRNLEQMQAVLEPLA